MLEDLFFSHPLTVMIGTVILAWALVVVATLGPSYFAEEHTCSKKAEMLSTDYRFGFWEGCWIKQNNTWIDYNTIRNVGVK